MNIYDKYIEINEILILFIIILLNYILFLYSINNSINNINDFN